MHDCTFVCVYVSVHPLVYACMRVCVAVCMSACMHVHMYVYACMHVFVCLPFTCVSMYVCMFVCMYVSSHLGSCTHSPHVHAPTPAPCRGWLACLCLPLRYTRTKQDAHKQSFADINHPHWYPYPCATFTPHSITQAKALVGHLHELLLAVPSDRTSNSHMPSTRALINQRNVTAEGL